jgi:hypothetical protein
LEPEEGEYESQGGHNLVRIHQTTEIVRPEIQENSQNEFTEHVVELVEVEKSENVQDDEVDQMIQSPEKRLEYVEQILRSGDQAENSAVMQISQSNEHLTTNIAQKEISTNQEFIHQI